MFWWFKLVTFSGDTFYYNYSELLEARFDKSKFGGSLTDRNGKIY